MDSKIETIVMGRFNAAHGWKADRIVTNSATRLHETAVGLKQSTVWLTYDRECSQYWIKADYQSRGANALSTCFACFPACADQATIEGHVDAFAAEAMDKISQTYAARLLKTGGAA